MRGAECRPMNAEPCNLRLETFNWYATLVRTPPSALRVSALSTQHSALIAQHCLLIWHVVVFQAYVMAEFMRYGVTHFLYDLLPSSA